MRGLVLLFSGRSAKGWHERDRDREPCVGAHVYLPSWSFGEGETAKVAFMHIDRGVHIQCSLLANGQRTAVYGVETS